MRSVAIVGAGASGLPSIRHALLYGIDVVCYESQDDIGGLWRYKPGETSESSVMKSTVINSSKERSAFSDFPPKPEAANFMHNTQMLQYFRDYAEHHNLLKCIQFNTKVLNIERTADYTRTGRWTVTVEAQDGTVSSRVFDGVLICTGHHTKPYWPEPWPGQDKFQGKIIHAHSYKDHRGYEDKVSVVVGIGNSGGDIAVELGRVAKQVYLVCRRGAWIFYRMADDGLPIDTEFTRARQLLINYLPRSYMESVLEAKLNHRFNHELFAIKPAHGVLGSHPTVNDELPNRIAAGTVRVKPQIKSFTTHGVQFSDGTKVEHVDAVIVATGYSIEFPIVENGTLINVNDNHVELYNNMYPMNLPHDSLAVIGLVQPFGSIMPVAEMQARVFYEALTGGTKLPSTKERKRDVDRKNAEMQKRFAKSRRHTIQVDLNNFLNELADLIGCRPSVWENLLFDTPVGMELLFGAVTGYQYRLRGPHPWEGARDAILTTEERIAKATNPKLNGIPGRKSILSYLLPYACLLILALLILR